jgi:hypothetical protein
MRFWSLLLVLFAVASCSKNKAGDFTKSKVKKEDLKLVHVETITLRAQTSKPVIASLLPPFKISPDGSRMAFYDYTHQYIIVTNSHGNIKYIAGEKGKGPSEFVKIQSWCFDEHNNLIVYDEGQKLIKIFDSKGTLEHDFNISSSSDFYLVGRKLYARNGFIYTAIIQSPYLGKRSKATKSNMIAIIDYDGTLKKMVGHYDPYVEQSPDYEINPIFAIKLKHHKLYSTHINSYRIQIWEIPTFKRTIYFGRRSRSYKEAKQKIPLYASKRKIQKMSLNQSFSVGLFVTSNYIIHFFENLSKEFIRTRDTNKRNYFINIYDKESHRLLSELQLPAYLGAMYNNKLYIIKDSNPDHYTIYVYEIRHNH